MSTEDLYRMLRLIEMEMAGGNIPMSASDKDKNDLNRLLIDAEKYPV